MYSDKTRTALCSVILLLSLLWTPAFVSGQQTVISGVITDARTGRPLSFVSVRIPGTASGTSTDEQGHFRLGTDAPARQIQCSFIGYKTVTQALAAGTDLSLVIRMEADNRELEEVVIRSGKRPRYRNRDNPAVDLVRQVIAHKDRNRAGGYRTLSYEEYERMMFSLSNKPEKLRKNLLVRTFSVLGNGIDTSRLAGKAILPVYMEEKLVHHYATGNPERHKKIVEAEKKVSLDKDFLDSDGMTVYLKHIYQPVDIYQNDIMVATNQFLSPIADLSPAFYRFYIQDTVMLDGDSCIGLFFSPRNREDFLFTGNMYITMDGSFAVRRIEMKVNRQVNINWIRDLLIGQEFVRTEDGHYRLLRSRVGMDFGLTGRSDGGIYGERICSYRNYVQDGYLPDTLWHGNGDRQLPGYDHRDNGYWQAHRHDSLSAAARTVYENMDSLQQMRSFKRVMNAMTLLLAGYSKAGDRMEIGPVNTFYGFNPVEGLRLRFGGRTTSRFSEHIYLEGYAAYGFRDQRWKYFGGVTYSFNGRNRFAFPASNISFSYQRDTKIPGQELQFIQEDNFLLSFKRGVNDKWLYNDIYQVAYHQEFRNNISYRLSLKNWRQEAAGGIRYQTEVSPDPVPYLTTTELGFELRWAPQQKFYQGKTYRIPFPNRYPVFTLRMTTGVKGLLGGQYDYQRIQAHVYKRFYLSQLGYTDVSADGGYIFGRLPYPLLEIPRANQTYSYQLQSYNLMNFLEFVTDHYAGIQMEHAFNGFLLNKVPLVKKLKLREYVSFKMLAGGLREENTPSSAHPGLFVLPADRYGRATTFSLAGQPYIEGSIGLGNILKFFRIDLVRRFTHLDHPYVSEYGIRGRFKFDF